MFKQPNLLFRLTAIIAAVLLCFSSFTRSNKASGISDDLKKTDRMSARKNLTNPAIDSITIPLKRAGRLFLIEAIIDDEAGNLIFDTGATGLVLNKSYFRNHTVVDQQSSNGITGSVEKVENINIEQIKVSDLLFKNISANLANLGHIENRRGIKVLGLFGFDLIRDYEIIINSKNNQLTLHCIDKKGNRTGLISKNFNASYSQKIETLNNIVFIKGNIGGKTLRFCFDTGAETNAVSNLANKHVLNTIAINRKTDLHGAGSAKSEVLFGVMNDFTLGNTRLNNMETIVTNLEHLNEAYGMHIDGMLGYNFVTKGILCINFKKKLLGVSFPKTSEL
ncbi:MAG: pepsin/retropepsin-like aspartic protease family protein [Bacteroidota bacterium]|nr:pepsin/retropepsin-like aspartic protease family protein [Bacteroidota bacterium]